MTEVRDDLDNFINSNNILIFTCYRVNGVHLLTHPYPIYTSNMIQPIILPFEKGILIYEGTCVVSYILKNQLHTNINWDSIRNIIYNKLFYILDYSTNYMNQYNFNYRYNFNEKDYDKIINLAEDTFTFNTFLMKSGKFNYVFPVSKYHIGTPVNEEIILNLISGACISVSKIKALTLFLGFIAVLKHISFIQEDFP